jgi:hypothetical protein
MSDIDRTKLTTDFLASLNRHLRLHGLGDTVISIDPPHRGRDCGSVHLYPFRSTDLGLFAEWLRTLRGVTASVNGFSSDNRKVHLCAVGAMDDGTPVMVRVIVEDAEFDLLAANTPLVKDAPIEADLLLSLVSADTAEALAGETALTGSAVPA